MVLIINDAQLSKKVFFALQNTFSSLNNIVKIETISMAIKETKKNRFFALG